MVESQTNIFRFLLDSDVTSEKNVTQPLDQQAKKCLTCNKKFNFNKYAPHQKYCSIKCKTYSKQISCIDCNKNIINGAKRCFNCNHTFLKSLKPLNQQIKKLCKCGCGNPIIIKYWHSQLNIPDYILSHHQQGKFKKGNIPWINGKKGLIPWNRGIPRTEKEKKKISETQKRLYKEGKIKSWNRGLTKETDHSLSELSNKLKGKPKSKDHRIKLSMVRLKGLQQGTIKVWNKGLTNKTDTRMKLLSQKRSESLKKAYRDGLLIKPKCAWKKGQLIGKNNYNWRGGTSFEPYTSAFNEKFKKLIRERDNFYCKRCDIHQNEHIKLYHKKLVIHHIDYNKKNTSINNCITLCITCNSIVNFNREYWTNHFQQLLKQIVPWGDIQ